MPLSRAIDVRAITSGFVSATTGVTVSMPLSRAVDVRVGNWLNAPQATTCLNSMPLPWQLVCGLRLRARSRLRADPVVSMPLSRALSRAVDVWGRVPAAPQIQRLATRFCEPLLRWGERASSSPEVRRPPHPQDAERTRMLGGRGGEERARRCRRRSRRRGGDSGGPSDEPRGGHPQQRPSEQRPQANTVRKRRLAW